MAVNCAASCEMCEMSRSTVRCALDRFNRTAALEQSPEALDAFFERAVAENGQYSPTVHMRPPEGPWVVTFDDFVTEAEIEGMFRHTRANLARSTDQGATDAATGVTAKVVSNRRTSSNSWCMGACEQDPQVRSLVAKIERLTGIASTHYEQFQVLRYEPGEEYQRHHDYVPRTGVPEPAGPRLLTMFLYFSEVEEGGETGFTDLQPPLLVTPKRGRALLWPSVMSHDHLLQDARTHHQARPVVRGTKYAANAWIHVHEFRKPYLWGCTGSFGDARAQELTGFHEAAAGNRIQAMKDQIKKATKAGTLKKELAKQASHATDDSIVGTPLHWAVSYGSMDAIKELLEVGAPLKAPGLRKGTPLHLAVFVNYEEGVQALLEAGASVKAKSEDGSTPLHWAAGVAPMGSANVRITKMLLDAGAPLETKAKGHYKDFTPLFHAVRVGNVEVIKMLLEAGANIDAVADGVTVEMVAKYVKQEDALQVLQEHRGADLPSYEIKSEL